MTTEELNRKISEARGHDAGCPLMNEGGPCGCLRDWTGSEDASAVLLDELIAHFPYFALCFESEQPTVEVEASGIPGGFWDKYVVDRKTAIALAWLKFKEFQ